MFIQVVYDKWGTRMDSFVSWWTLSLLENSIFLFGTECLWPRVFQGSGDSLDWVVSLPIGWRSPAGQRSLSVSQDLPAHRSRSLLGQLSLDSLLGQMHHGPDHQHVQRKEMASLNSLGCISGPEDIMSPREGRIKMWSETTFGIRRKRTRNWRLWRECHRAAPLGGADDHLTMSLWAAHTLFQASTSGGGADPISSHPPEETVQIESLSRNSLERAWFRQSRKTARRRDVCLLILVAKIPSLPSKITEVRYKL